MVISSLEIQKSEFAHWMYCLKSIDVLLNDFKLNLQEKRDLLYKMNSFQGKYYDKDRTLAKQLSKKYRDCKQDISSLLISNQWPFSLDKGLIREIDIRSTRNEVPIGHITKLIVSNNNLKERIISSIIHIHIYRMFNSRFNKMELVLYDFLFRFYKSESIKGKAT